MPKPLSKLRLAAFKTQNARCYYCGAPMWLANPSELTTQLAITKDIASRLQCTSEHLLARCDGGDAARQNIVAACRFCNSNRHARKKALDPIAYRRFVTKRMRAGKWHPPEIHRMLGKR